MVCQQCEVTPPGITGDKSYYFWPPIGHSRSKIVKALADVGATFNTDDSTQAIRLDAPIDAFKKFSVTLTGALSSEERRATVVLVKDYGQSPAISDIPQARSFEAVSNLVDAGWLLSMMDEKRLGVTLDMVVHAEEWDDVFALSARLHGVDPAGNQIGDQQIYQTASAAHILAPVDRASRLAAIQTAGRARTSLPTFVPFSPSSIYDPEFCLRSTVAEVKQAGIDPSLIIFTVMMTEYLLDIDHLRGILRYYRNAGFQVALGDMGSGSASLDLLAHLKPDLIRISPAVAAGVGDDPYKSVVVRKLLEMAQRLRIDTVACGVNDEQDATFLYEHGSNYLEGPFVSASLPGASTTTVAP